MTVKEIMSDTSASGQLLGYSIQYTRALKYLLQASEGDVICVEHLGDVAVISEQALISEEAKSSVNGNPVTNRSEDLWKTLSNWINAILAGQIDVEKTKFVLYTNKQGREGIVNWLHEAESTSEATATLAQIKAELSNVNDQHPIWPYYKNVLDNESLFLALIPRFDFQIGNEAGFDELRSEVTRLIVPEEQIDFVIAHLTGWVVQRVMESAAKKEATLITRKEFSQTCLVLLQKIRQRELIDFTLSQLPSQDQIQNQISSRPTYVKQLDLLNLDEDDIIEAISDFLRAETNRSKWIMDGFIDEESAADFEGRLKEYWKNEKVNVALTCGHFDDETKGRILLSKCKSRLEPLRNQTPPNRTIQGTYHALANREDGVGWHPNWLKLFKKDF